jgi:hypothetical protein
MDKSYITYKGLTFLATTTGGFNGTNGSGVHEAAFSAHHDSLLYVNDSTAVWNQGQFASYNYFKSMRFINIERLKIRGGGLFGSGVADTVDASSPSANKFVDCSFDIQRVGENSTGGFVLSWTDSNQFTRCNIAITCTPSGNNGMLKLYTARRNTFTDCRFTFTNNRTGSCDECGMTYLRDRTYFTTFERDTFLLRGVAWQQFYASGSGVNDSVTPTMGTRFSYCVFRHSAVAASGQSGFLPTWQGGMRDDVFEFNSVVGNSLGGWGTLGTVVNAGVRVRNNVFIRADGGPILGGDAVTAGAKIRNNIYVQGDTHWDLSKNNGNWMGFMPAATPSDSNLYWCYDYSTLTKSNFIKAPSGAMSGVGPGTPLASAGIDVHSNYANPNFINGPIGNQLGCASPNYVPCAMGAGTFCGLNTQAVIEGFDTRLSASSPARGAGGGALHEDIGPVAYSKPTAYILSPNDSLVLSTATHALVKLRITPQSCSGGNYVKSLWASDSTGFAIPEVLFYGDSLGVTQDQELSERDGRAIQLGNEEQVFWVKVNSDSSRTGRGVINFRSNDTNNTDLHLPVSITASP